MSSQHCEERHTAPVQTALMFLVSGMAMDLFVVALSILRSVEMIRHPLGRWIPLALSFLSIYVGGLLTSGMAPRLATA